ncbi:MAG: hypothetical protein PHH68_02785 [Candidatus Omnitrophica bacterium]|jgi:hypothetical protein|nr:hypothetical protein [Candidatus Omnitrophota bacterium]MDD5079232.1 hypothetical protein [Candidatus Omnitrophota bacterium]
MKTKIYRIIGSVLLSLSLVSYGISAFKFASENHLKYPLSYLILPLLTFLALHPGIWISLYLFRIAERNDTPNKKSQLLKLIKIYAVFAGIMLLRTMYLVVMRYQILGIYIILSLFVLLISIPIIMSQRKAIR